MSEQEARDDEREAREDIESTIGMVMAERIPDASLDDDLFDAVQVEIADLLVRNGYRKHPEREITDEMVERAEYIVCGEDDPWIELEDGVMRRALEAALRVSVTEETNRVS